MAGAFTFRVVIHEDFDRVLTWSTSSTPVSQGGTPVDLTGFTAFMSVGAAENFITTTSGPNGLITLGGTAGTLRLQIPAAVLSTFAVGGTDYRLFVTNAVPETACLLSGTIQVRP